MTECPGSGREIYLRVYHLLNEDLIILDVLCGFQRIFCSGHFLVEESLRYKIFIFTIVAPIIAFICNTS